MNNKEIQNLRSLLESGQRMAISTKDFEKIFDEIDRLKQENETIKKQYNCYACDTCNGKEDYRNMKRHCENAINTVHKYSSALEDINRALLGVKGLSIHCNNQIIKVKALINEVLNEK